MTEPTLDERFVVLSPTGRDAELTCRLLRGAGLTALVCAGMSDACRAVEAGAAALLVAEEALVPSAITLLTGLLTAQAPWSDLPILLFTGAGARIQNRTATPQLLAPLGNVVLLDRPLRPMTMISAARSALRARRRQYDAREVMSRQRSEVQQRDQFLAMLGHELRNPIGAILLAAELLGRSDDISRQRDIIRRQGQKLARLMDDLLDVARVTSGKVVLQRQVVELNDAVERTVASLQAAIAAQHLELRLRSAGYAVPVFGDPIRLDQIFGNLLTNAIKYTPPGGHVEVSIELVGERARVRVEDDGVGISAAMLPRIFDLFTQAERSLDRSQGGLGIGLTLVRTLVVLHGGTVCAASPGPGRGTVVTVELPIASADCHRMPLASRSPLACASRPSRVLVIEDNDDTRELLQALLESFGHEVAVAADGEAGVARVQDLRPEVVIIDIGLPKIDGYAVAREVRETLGANALLIALTGYGQPDDRRRALEAGFNVHCAKPIEPEQLQRLVSRPH